MKTRCIRGGIAGGDAEQGLLASLPAASYSNVYIGVTHSPCMSEQRGGRLSCQGSLISAANGAAHNPQVRIGNIHVTWGDPWNPRR